MINEIWLAGGTRTPIGGFLGTLAEVPAPALGSVAIKESLHRAGVAADQVDEVILGNVVGSGPGAERRPPGRHRAPGCRSAVGATTVNKVCGSGMKTVMLAAQAIQCGDAQAVVAGGTENMSAAPYLLPKARNGYRLGNGELVDAVIKDGLWDVYNNLHMGTLRRPLRRQGRNLPAGTGRFRRGQLSSGPIKAQKEKLFAEEMVAVEIKGRKGSVFVSEDETTGPLQRRETAGPAAGLRRRRQRHGRQRLEHQRRRRRHRRDLAARRPRTSACSRRPRSSATRPTPASRSGSPWLPYARSIA